MTPDRLNEIRTRVVDTHDADPDDLLHDLVFSVVPELLEEVMRLRTELRQALLVAHDDACRGGALDDCPHCGPRLRAALGG